MIRSCLFATIVASTLLLFISNANALLLDFEDAGFLHGSIVTSSQGVSIEADNLGGGPDLAIIFDSMSGSTRDPDLIAPWAGGNLFGTSTLGNMLIIAENGTDSTGDGIIDDPDDEGSRPAGSLRFDFTKYLTAISFDLVDVEGGTENGNISFYDGNSLLKSITFEQFTDSGDSFYQSNVAFGNNYANAIDELTLSDLGINAFNRIDFNLAGSGAIDNVNVTPVPEPATMFLLGAGLAGLAAGRRRKKQ